MAGKYDGQAIGMFELDSLGACYIALMQLQRQQIFRFRALKEIVKKAVHV